MNGLLAHSSSIIITTVQQQFARFRRYESGRHQHVFESQGTPTRLHHSPSASRGWTPRSPLLSAHVQCRQWGQTRRHNVEGINGKNRKETWNMWHRHLLHILRSKPAPLRHLSSCARQPSEHITPIRPGWLEPGRYRMMLCCS